jgi:hypothetical protein
MAPLFDKDSLCTRIPSELLWLQCALGAKNSRLVPLWVACHTHLGL